MRLWYAGVIAWWGALAFLGGLLGARYLGLDFPLLPFLLISGLVLIVLSAVYGAVWVVWRVWTKKRGG